MPAYNFRTKWHNTLSIAEKEEGSGAGSVTESLLNNGSRPGNPKVNGPERICIRIAGLWVQVQYLWLVYE